MRDFLARSWPQTLGESALNQEPQCLISTWYSLNIESTLIKKESVLRRKGKEGGHCEGTHSLLGFLKLFSQPQLASHSMKPTLWLTGPATL
jgi:hypothetical protein